jgi:succinylglutamate desuccinylase
MKISRHPDIQGVVSIDSGVAGPRVVLFGGVHGDEVSGVHAVEKLFFDLYGGKRRLVRGSLTLARGNEAALGAEKRYIKHNLNRMFKDDYGPEIDRSSYEYARAQELKPLLRTCDYFLDLHSAPTAQEPFLVVEAGPAEFYAQLGVARLMTGWSKFSGGTTGGDAENYANSHGAQAATLESGCHFDKASIDVANQAALSFLSILEMIEPGERPAPVPFERYDVYEVVTKDFADFRYAGEVKNFQLFRKGEAFAFQNGRPLAVAEDTHLLIPMTPADTKIGEEVCYLGRRLAD